MQKLISKPSPQSHQKTLVGRKLGVTLAVSYHSLWVEEKDHTQGTRCSLMTPFSKGLIYGSMKV